MTEKEKARAYDKVYKKVAVRFGSNVADEIFSEFEGSDDERISKEIIKYLEQTVPHNHRDEVLKSKEWVAWLEKQGEQRTACSEEDEDYYDAIIAKLEVTQDDAALTDNQMEFLKSLKPQKQWKPSEEQMDAIRRARSFVVDDFGEHPTLSEILMELEEQLKKLKGE